MGCCYSRDTQDPAVKPLIPHPQPVVHSDDWNVAAQESPSADDHALFSFIVDKAAKSIIDISAVNPKVQQPEYMDRVRQYSTRLSALSQSFSWRRPTPWSSLTTEPLKMLAADFVKYSDLQQVSKIAAYAFSAIMQIHVDTEEELVVQLIDL